VRTPYGDPSAPPVVGEVGGRRVVFIPRHGTRSSG
jgi:5'-methylthioadenosine phosphorylase